MNFALETFRHVLLYSGYWAGKARIIPGSDRQEVIKCKNCPCFSGGAFFIYDAPEILDKNPFRKNRLERFLNRINSTLYTW